MKLVPNADMAAALHGGEHFLVEQVDLNLAQPDSQLRVQVPPRARRRPRAKDHRGEGFPLLEPEQLQLPHVRLELVRAEEEQPGVPDREAF
eukprot:CAMPEP_0195607410 /NCGR_PEP_ID=MMETSP0815-20121206/8202_1 /TAXON_ID=97485 /ORGANISM="Prymnesium parvum, Strain Texoma1" /LENGTH=90 /DNA_ID=CAMNT_0040747213 /DNA_START=528 /DNA_END=799 /DNA_ORIENTATION=+